MGFFTAWTEAAYPATLPPPAAEAPGFDLGTARALAWCAQLAYEAGEPAKLAAILGRWGWQLHGTLGERGARARLLGPGGGFVAGAGGATVAAFAGTEPERPTDWLRILDARPDREGASSGMADAAAAVRSALAALLEACTGPLLLTGHSLGGAIAALAARPLCTTDGPRPDLRAVYTYGMPRPGTGAFSARYDATATRGGEPLGRCTFRLIHGGDAIPTLPPRALGHRHLGRPLVAGHGERFDPGALAPAPVDDSGSADVGLVLRAALGLGRDRDPAYPPYPAANPAAAAVVERLPRALRDHVMDRTLHALRP